MLRIKNGLSIDAHPKMMKDVVKESHCVNTSCLSPRKNVRLFPVKWERKAYHASHIIYTHKVMKFAVARLYDIQVRSTDESG